MYPYEAEVISRAIIADRLREADHQRLVREVRQYKRNAATTATATVSANRRSRLWKLVHLSHAYG